MPLTRNGGCKVTSFLLIDKEVMLNAMKEILAGRLKVCPEEH